MAAGEPPFGPNVKPDLVGHGVRTWFSNPPGMVNLYAPGVPIDPKQAEQVTQTATRVMDATFPRAERFIYVHDFSLATGHTTGAREAFTHWGLERLRAGRVDAVYLCFPTAAMLFRMAAFAVVAVLRTAGMDIEVVDDLAPLFERRNIRPRRG